MTTPIRILVVDDEFSVRDSLQAWFRDSGYETEVAASGKEALAKMGRQRFDIFLLDIKMAGMDGLELQETIKEHQENPIIIFMTAYASVDTAVRALKQGAFDYVTKPIDPEELERLVRNAAERRLLQKENLSLKVQIEELTPFKDIIGESQPIRDVVELIKNVAPTDTTVLIRGESGTGKELVARAIHAASPRRFMPFVTVNCGALPEGLLESELFGHEQGAFTGAQFRHKGKFELADGGTLFLDEIGDVSLKTQTDLLRVLQEREITRLGGTKPIKVDFRLIAATNCDLEARVAEKSFRGDLYYRLNVFPIVLPSLKARPGDIPMLAGYFLQKYARKMNRPIRGISASAMALLSQHSWPGNVRELENSIERAVIFCKGDELLPEHLPIHRSAASKASSGLPLSEVEKIHIQRVLAETGGNISKSARVLGIDRATLYNKIKRYGLFVRE
ncbi:MAG: sigma-54-dependent transcriptional regulator [Acidobacteriota bacterium]